MINKAGRGKLKFIIGNKSDLKERCVSYSDGEKKAKELGCAFIESSAKTMQNVNEAFQHIVDDLFYSKVPSLNMKHEEMVALKPGVAVQSSCC